MFPWIDGSHWGAGHIIFMSLFFAVLVVLSSVVAVAISDTRRDFQSQRVSEVCWREEFGALPEAERHCRHEFSGRVARRICPNAFACRDCPQYAEFAALPPMRTAQAVGVPYSDQLLYHRGHTWVRQEDDGTLTIGLDELAQHVIGKPDSVALPSVGSKINCDGIAWRMKKNGHDIRVRAAVDGTVVATRTGEDGWYLKVRPRSPVDVRHLLRAEEVRGWLSAELDRLQLQLRAPQSEPAMSDGGMLLPDLMDSLPDTDWDRVLPSIFLEA
jgi:glycine cleavage system H protein